jgi:phage virion morphogenesis protein
MELVFNDEVLLHKLNTMAENLTHIEPLMGRISGVLVSVAQDNFSAQGRPAWAGLSPATIASYRKRGFRVNSILQKSGNLKNSLQGSHDATSATVGAGSGPSKDYAAIHQFGGFAGRGRKVKIPARPYLPMDKDGNLQREAEDTVSDVVDHYWQSAMK